MTNREAGTPCASHNEFERVRVLIEQELKAIDSEVEQINARLSGLQAKRGQLEQDLNHLSAASKILEKFEGRVAKPARQPVTAIRGNFSNLTQREAILQVLSQNPTQALNKKALTQALIEGGFPFRSVERAERQNTVYQTCRRMVEARELVMLIQGRDGYYRLADSKVASAEMAPSARGFDKAQETHRGVRPKNGNGVSQKLSAVSDQKLSAINDQITT
ncbi:MAG: hypothetical protein ACE15E_02905 [Acidobacteriota bacterium]